MRWIKNAFLNDILSANFGPENETGKIKKGVASPETTPVIQIKHCADRYEKIFKTCGISKRISVCKSMQTRNLYRLPH